MDGDSGRRPVGSPEGGLGSVDDLDRYFFADQEHERAEIEFLCAHVDPSRRYCVFDIGANIGLYTYHLNRVLRRSRIICVEADPDVYARLRANTELWSGQSDNTITCINKAASDKAGTIAFHTAKDLTVGSLVDTSGGLRAHGERDHIEVEATTLSNLVRDAKIEPDEQLLCKIDVEGAEYRVLSGGLDVLENHPEMELFLEIHWWGDKQLGVRPRDVCHLLLRQGFGFRLVGGHWLFRRTGAGGLAGSVLTQYWRFALQLRGRAYPFDLLKRIFGGAGRDLAPRA